MGTRSSTLANPQCPACGGPALDSDKINPQFCLCKRCGGYVETEAPKSRRKQAPVPSQVGGGAYDAVNASDDSKEESALQGPLGARRLPQLRVKLVHILPFRESLPDEDRDADERLLLEKYIIPFFAGGGHVVESGARFQINSVDFKVVSCFPPYGLTAPDTVFRSMMGHLSALSQLQKIHILPTAASIAVSNAKHLFDNNLRPYFAGPDHRHMMEGDTFVSQGVQFKVIAAVPTNGVVTERTEIFTEGEPLRDADRIHILPIYETLPNRDKRLTAEERFKKYLEPFFLGRFQVVAQGQEIAIDGVDWKVIACDPPRGVVTYKTIIFAAGDALRADDVKRQQMEEDERLAMELQRQEGGLMMPPPGAMLRVSAPGWPGGGPVLIPVGGMRGGPPLAAAMNQRAELRHRLQELLRIMPPNDRNRVVIQRLHDRLSQPPAAADGAQMVNFFRLMQALQESNPESNGASVEEIDALPTRKFVPFEHSEEKAEEALKCMVCLCEYSEGEELRTLPCFHSYHKECIDKWLSNNVKCPICKHPIN